MTLGHPGTRCLHFVLVCALLCAVRADRGVNGSMSYTCVFTYKSSLLSAVTLWCDLSVILGFLCHSSIHSLHYTTDPQTSMSKFSCAFVNQLCLPSYQLTLSPVLCHSPLTGLWQREYKGCLICKTNNENMLYSLKKLHCHLLKYIASSFHFVTLLTMSKNIGKYKLTIIYICIFYCIYLSLFIRDALSPTSNMNCKKCWYGALVVNHSYTKMHDH